MARARVLRGAALLLALVLTGCPAVSVPSSRAECESFCADAGLVVERLYLRAPWCACGRPPIEPSCDPAWSRANTALDLLGDCRSALLECQARGGGR